MIILGLTGGIAMGKSTVLGQFASLGAHTREADHAVHRLLAKGGAGVAPVARAFPQTHAGDAIDRAKLGETVFSSSEKLAVLEAILHPLVRRALLDFAAKAERKGAHLAVLDVPLLFEAGFDEYCDYVVTVSCPPFIQRERALARPGMTEEKLQFILARQMKDEERRAASDFVVETGLGKALSMRQAIRIVKTIGKQDARDSL